MPARNWNLSWLSHNSQRAYPLVDDATAKDTSGSFSLPTDFLVELYLPVHAGLSVLPGRFLLHSVGVYSAGYSVVVGYDDGTTIHKVASAVIAKSTHAKNAVYALGGIGDFADTMGRVVIGNLANIDRQPAGLWQFDLSGSRLESDCIRPIIRGIPSIRAKNGAEVSDPAYGHIVLSAGTNCRIDVIRQVDAPVEFRINAIQGAGLNELCGCLDTGDAVPIRRINGIPPTTSGDFTVLGSDCLRVDEIVHGIQLNDTCSEPCCGCKELETITSALEAIRVQAATAEHILASLESRVTQMDMAVLGAL